MTTFTVTYQGKKAQANLNVQTSKLKKFFVNFRRQPGYNGEYGFDWLRDEYIHPIVTVSKDHNGAAFNAPLALCEEVAAIKSEYKTKDVLNPISPHGIHYYPAWLTMYPDNAAAKITHGPSIQTNGIDLDIEIVALEALSQDDTILIFESSNANIKISSSNDTNNPIEDNKVVLNLKDFLGLKQIKSLGGSLKKEFYSTGISINVKCIDCLLYTSPSPRDRQKSRMPSSA